MMKIKNEKGITLIALIITIIVLLILAGVSIATITGENGILERAKNAKEVNDNKSSEEKGILSQYEEEIDNYNTIGIVRDTKDKFEILETGSWTSPTIPKGGAANLYTVPLKNSYTEEQQAHFVFISNTSTTGTIAPYVYMDNYLPYVVGNNHSFHMLNGAGTGNRWFSNF